MPYYIFQHIETKEVREVFYHMNDKKEYAGEDGAEVGLWERQYIIPQMAVDSSFAKVDPWDAKSFVRKTAKVDTLGSILDRSRELHEKRGGDKNDPVKEKYLKDYGKTRSGAIHPEILKRRAKKRLEKKGIIIEP